MFFFSEFELTEVNKSCFVMLVNTDGVLPKTNGFQLVPKFAQGTSSEKDCHKMPNKVDVIYQTRDSVFHHISKHREES